MQSSSGLIAAGLLLALLAGCAPSYSPNTYDGAAAQKANKVEQGVIVGVRTVRISVDATVGTVTGGAAGGIAGSQVAGGAGSALGALGGSVVGGLLGNATAHVVDDTPATEYIVRQTNGDLLSVTQKDKVPLAVGQHVLVITGNQARVLVDYTVPAETPKPALAKATAPPEVPVPLATTTDLPPLATTTAEPLPITPLQDKAAPPAVVEPTAEPSIVKPQDGRAPGSPASGS